MRRDERREWRDAAREARVAALSLTPQQFRIDRPCLRLPLDLTKIVQRLQRRRLWAGASIAIVICSAVIDRAQSVDKVKRLMV